jgi:DNA-binding winged helix-turn-helix (wHTH) protein
MERAPLRRVATITSADVPTRFGDFTFDEHTGELRNTDGRTRLQPDASLALQLLLEHQGDIVSVAALKEKMAPGEPWAVPDDDVDADIRQLRIALGDDVHAPRFIETVPDRGYRFLMPVIDDGIGIDEDAGAPVSSVRSRYLMSGLLALLYLAFLLYSRWHNR